MSRASQVEAVIKSLPSLSEIETLEKLNNLHQFCQTERDGYLVLLGYYLFSYFSFHFKQ
jgi:hypothetical protein